MEPALYMLECDADHARRGDTSGLESWVNGVEQDPQSIRTVQGSVAIVFPDFEDVEFIFSVPEVQSFIRQAHNRIRHLFYYLFPGEQMGALLGFFIAHAEVEKVATTGGKIGVNVHDPTLLAPLIDRLIATARFADRMGDDTEQILSHILEPMGTEQVDQDSLSFLGIDVDTELGEHVELRKAVLVSAIDLARTG